MTIQKLRRAMFRSRELIRSRRLHAVMPGPGSAGLRQQIYRRSSSGVVPLLWFEQVVARVDPDVRDYASGGHRMSDDAIAAIISDGWVRGDGTVPV